MIVIGAGLSGLMAGCLFPGAQVHEAGVPVRFLHFDLEGDHRRHSPVMMTAVGGPI